MFLRIPLVILSISLSGVVQGSFSDNFTTNVKTSTSNLLGVNCMVEAVLDLEDAADEFSYQIRKRCGQASKLETELSDTEELMKITTKVININDKVCENAAYDEEEDAETKPKAKCVVNLKYQMANLLTSFTKTRKDINSGLRASYSKDACVKMAMKNFKCFLGKFGLRIDTCAQRAAEV